MFRFNTLSFFYKLIWRPSRYEGRQQGGRQVTSTDWPDMAAGWVIGPKGTRTGNRRPDVKDVTAGVPLVLQHLDVHEVPDHTEYGDRSNDGADIRKTHGASLGLAQQDRQAASVVHRVCAATRRTGQGGSMFFPANSWLNAKRPDAVHAHGAER